MLIIITFAIIVFLIAAAIVIQPVDVARLVIPLLDHEELLEIHADTGKRVFDAKMTPKFGDCAMMGPKGKPLCNFGINSVARILKRLKLSEHGGI